MRYQDNPLIRKKYNSTKWQKVRKLKILQTNGLCERCLKEHKYEPGVIVHHKEYINESNYFDDDVMYNLDNLELLCEEHHLQEHFKQKNRFDENGDLIG